MDYIGVSLIIASVVWVIVAPPPWMHPFMPPFLLSGRHAKPSPTLPPPTRSKSPPRDETNGHAREEKPQRSDAAPPSLNLPDEPDTSAAPAPSEPSQDRAAMPPPPLPVISPPAPVIAEPEEQTTPKAKPFTSPAAPPVPAFSLDGPSKTGLSTGANPLAVPGRGSMPPPPVPSGSSNGMMPPPPTPRGPVPPRLAAFPAMNSPQRARPVPNRGPAGGSGSSLGSSLAPPSTHSSKPSKPSRKVVLTPGHSPLDWARISGPNADLRNLPASTLYLKVTPSMLKKMTGRKGKDAWMALGGRVYNITPYLPYHPAGVPELLRGAGRDATKLFGEVHPWVNYETMLSACLIGLLVDEEEGAKPSEMDQMD